MKNYISILLITVIYLFQIGCAKIVYVSQNATGNGNGESWENAYTSINQALDVSKHDDKEEIWVAAGRYQESVTMKQKIKIFGGFTGHEKNREERNCQENVTIIDGTCLSCTTVYASDIDRYESDGFTAELNGFTIQGAQKSGIYCLKSSPIISNCIIENNTAEEGGGLYFEQSSPIVSFCIIKNNNAEKGAGVYCTKSSPRFTKCVIAKNTASSGGGLYCQDQSYPGLINCTIAKNQENGIECWSGSLARFLNCIVWNAGVQIAGENAPIIQVEYSCVKGGWIGLGNIDNDPLFVNDESSDYHLQYGSPCIDAGIPIDLWNDAHRPPGLGTIRGDMGAYGGPEIEDLPILLAKSRILYVRSDAKPDGDGLSWDTALPTINAAITLQEFGEIWVAAGRYNESINMKSDVALYGGFAGGESSRNERDWSVNETIIDSSGLNNSAVLGANRALLDGFTVTGGNESRVKCIVASPILINCTITSKATMTDGSGVECDRSSPQFFDCKIVGNSTIDNGGGIRCIGLGSPKFVNCHIKDNTASQGGGAYCCMGTTPTITNCIIASNTATDNENSTGGGLHFLVEPPTLINCIITENKGSGIYTDFGNTTIINCIVWNNSGPEIAGNNIHEIVSVTYSCIEGGWPGEGNIDADPLFVNPEKGDYHLQNGSPCIDTGFVSKSPNDDIEGRSRPGNDNLVDMGAYESPSEFNGMTYVHEWMIHE